MGTLASRAAVVVLAGVIAISPVRAEDEPVAKKIEAVIDAPEYKHARWGILVVDAKTGDVVFARDADKFTTPASVTKLFSCAAAIIAHGPDHRFETPVYRRGDVTKDGVLKGDLILVASGDPSFGGRTTADGKLAFTNSDHTYANFAPVEAELTDTNPVAALDALAKQVKDAGVKEVAGEVLIDDRLFTPTRGTGSGPDAVTPIVVNDNALDLVVIPAAKPGDPAAVKMRPETTAFQMDAVVSTVEKDTPAAIVLHPAGGNQFIVRGKVPAGGKTFVRIYPVEEPALFARTLFIEALRRQAVRVAAPLARPAAADFPPADGYGDLPKVAAYQSAPFSELTKVTLKVSHNLYASALPCLVAVKQGKRTAEEGLHEQRKILKDLGVDVAATSFGGGAGGSVSDGVTPRATVQLLQGMAKRPEWEAYKNGLPSLGVDGTLATAVAADSPVKGKAFGKTGTLLWPDVMNDRGMLKSKALAGVMTTKAGRELVFAMFVNDAPLEPGVGPSREGKALGKLCEILYGK